MKHHYLSSIHRASARSLDRCHYSNEQAAALVLPKPAARIEHSNTSHLCDDNLRHDDGPISHVTRHTHATQPAEARPVAQAERLEARIDRLERELELGGQGGPRERAALELWTARVESTHATAGVLERGALDFLVRWGKDGGHCMVHRHVAPTTCIVLEGESLDGARVHVDIARELLKGRVSLKAAFDADGSRMKV